MLVTSGLLVSLAAWATFFVLYQLTLVGCYFLVRENLPLRKNPLRRFAVIIPAHDEEVMIGTNLSSWNKMDYPKSHFDVYVIADNCTDRTEEIASSHGAITLARHDLANKGKGQALAWALDRIHLKPYEAVVIVDADTIVCPVFLTAMNTRLLNGARVVQGFDGVLNPDQNAMTRVIRITNVIKNLLFNHAKSKVGLSVQLMGTGMCFDRAVLRQIGWRAFSKGEDGEQFAHLAEAGIRVVYEPRAKVFADEAGSLRQAYTQRIRWVSGRMQLVGLGLRLLLRGIRSFDVHLMDASLTFLTPNYVELANFTTLGLIVSWVLPIPGQHVLSMWFLALLGGQVLYFVIGLVMADRSWQTMKALGFVPIFLLWRLWINIMALFHVRRSEWVRTLRTRYQDTQDHPDHT